MRVKVALVDGGATHALRRGTRAELADSEPVTVELAHGSVVLKKKRHCSTLLTEEDVEPILPIRLLIDHGFTINWTATEIQIIHPKRGSPTLLEKTGMPRHAPGGSPRADEGA